MNIMNKCLILIEEKVTCCETFFFNPQLNGNLFLQLVAPNFFQLTILVSSVRLLFISDGPIACCFKGQRKQWMIICDGHSLITNGQSQCHPSSPLPFLCFLWTLFVKISSLSSIEKEKLKLDLSLSPGQCRYEGRLLLVENFEQSLSFSNFLQRAEAFG